MVGHALLLVRDHLLGHRHDRRTTAPRRSTDALVAHLLDAGLGLLLRLRVPVAVERPHERAALARGRAPPPRRPRPCAGRPRPGARSSARARPRRCRSSRRRSPPRPRTSRATPSAARSRPAGKPVAARQVAPAALAQRAALHEPLGVAPPSAARRRLGVLRRQRQLVGGRRPGAARWISSDSWSRIAALHRAVEELVGVAAEELVERVVAGHVHREARCCGGPARPHIWRRLRDGARERHADRGVEVADVDAELERVGGHDGQQVALGQPPLDLAPLRRRVAGAVGRDPLGQVAAARVLEPQAA